MRADTIAAHGNPHIRTPTLDDLARRGFSFRNAYVFGGDSGAVCVASRAMLMSGRTLFHVETTTLANAPLLPELLGRAGYVTFGTGKWHNGEASWLRAFQQGRTVMFGGMSDHTKVPVKDLGANGQLTAARVETTFSSELFADSAIALPARAEGAGTVLRLRRLHRAARPSPAAAGVPAGLLRQPAAAAGELPAAVPVRQRRDARRPRREPRRVAAHRSHGARPVGRVLRDGDSPGRPDPAHPRCTGGVWPCTRHHRRVRGRQRPRPRQSRPARQAERLRAQHACPDDDRRAWRAGRRGAARPSRTCTISSPRSPDWRASRRRQASKVRRCSRCGRAVSSARATRCFSRT